MNLYRIYIIYEKEIMQIKTLNISGDDNIEAIPVPIPNTEVKLYCAEDIYGLPC